MPCAYDMQVERHSVAHGVLLFGGPSRSRGAPAAFAESSERGGSEIVGEYAARLVATAEWEKESGDFEMFWQRSPQALLPTRALCTTRRVEGAGRNE